MQLEPWSKQLVCRNVYFILSINNGFFLFVRALKKEVDMLVQKREELDKAINQQPTKIQIQDDINHVQKLLPVELRKAKIWRKRKELLSRLQSDLKPVNMDESVGFFSTKLFPLAELPVDLSAAPTMPPPSFQRSVNEEQAAYTSPSRPLTATGITGADTQGGIPVNSGLVGSTHNSDLICGILPIAFSPNEHVKKNHVKLTDIMAARKADKYLDRVFRGLKGRESVLLASMNKDGVPTQNIIGWTAYEVSQSSFPKIFNLFFISKHDL